MSLRPGTSIQPESSVSSGTSSAAPHRGQLFCDPSETNPHQEHVAFAAECATVATGLGDGSYEGGSADKGCVDAGCVYVGCVFTGSGAVADGAGIVGAVAARAPQ